MNRREVFKYGAGVLLGGLVVPCQARGGNGWADFLKQTLPKNMDISLVNQGEMNFNLAIDGLKLPAFSWGWFAANIGIGVLQSLGGSLFTRFLGQSFGGKSADQLLREFLTAAADVIEVKLQENDLRNYQALLLATQRNMSEFANSPKGRDRLESATTDSQKLAAQFESLGFLGYRAYMVTAGLRLAVLQERMKLDPTEKKNYDAAREVYITHHKRMDAQIIQEASFKGQQAQVIERRDRFLKSSGPLYWYGLALGDDPNPNMKGKLYGEPYSGTLKAIDWQGLQDRIRQNSTKLGEKIITLWASPM